MKLKKVLICALYISLLASCGNQETEEKPVEEPKAVEETHTEVKEEAKLEEKVNVKEEPAKAEESPKPIDDNKETVEEAPKIAIKTHDLISGGGEKVGTMSVSIAQESQITDEYIKQWFEKVDKMNNDYDILLSSESMEDTQAHGVWRMGGGMVFKNVYFEKDENGVYAVSDSENSEYFDINK